MIKKESNLAIIIPARISSTRLKDKPLIKIGNLTLIEHVISNLKDHFFHNLYVATDDKKIASIVEKFDAVTAIMTDENCPSGSDRVFQALQKIDNNKNIDYVLNIQGDMPFLNYSLIDNLVKMIKTNNYDIVTPISKVNKEKALSESNVKVVIDKQGKALYFSRSLIPFGSEDFFYHIGIYAFKRTSLEKFIKLEQTSYEKCEKLEQLRALQHGMSIGTYITKEIPISIDTEHDLEEAKKYYNKYIKK